MTTSTDQQYTGLLRRAIQLAIDNVDQGRAPFGALVVLDGEVVGTGVNTNDQDVDPTAHAEVAAVRAACTRLGTQDLSGAVVVSSCEPCAMCQVVCTVAQVSEVVYAAPKEYVPDDGAPRPDLVRMQETLRSLAGDAVRQVPTEGADEPFTRYVQRTGRRP
jgi:guanine deaminase